MKALLVAREELEVGDFIIGEEHVMIRVAAIEFGENGRSAMMDRFIIKTGKWEPKKEKIPLSPIINEEKFLIVRD